MERFTTANFKERVASLQKTPQEYLDALGFTEERYTPFKNITNSAFTEIITSGNYEHDLSKFRFAYEFRKNESWNRESGAHFGKPNGLVEGVENVFNHAGFVKNNIIPESKLYLVDDVFKLNLLSAVPQAIELNRGILKVASLVETHGSSIDEISQKDMKEVLLDLIDRYWDRTPVALTAQYKK